MAVPEEMIATVRRAIMGMYKKKQHVTLDTILAQLKENKTRQTKWQWCRTTLYTFLTTSMNYVYKPKKSYYKSLKENAAIAEQRVRFIKQIQAYRSEGRSIFYQDETWINKNMTPLKAWMDQNAKGGPSLPPGKGDRSIICHVGNEDGFLEQAKLIYRGKKALKESDYHSDMNGDVFIDWMQKQVFKNVPKGSVIVIDRATYHQVLTEDTKPASSKLNKI